MNAPKSKIGKEVLRKYQNQIKDYVKKHGTFIGFELNSKKKEEKRKKRGLLTFDEHMQRRKEGLLKNWSKNPKNRDKEPFAE